MTRDSRRATALAFAWTAALVALAALWVRSPFLGERAAFLLWSGPAAVLLASSVRWIRSQGVQEIPDGPWVWATIGGMWLVALWLTATDLGDDSVRDERLRLVYVEDGLGLWELAEAGRQVRCHRGRGPGGQKKVATVERFTIGARCFCAISVHEGTFR